MKLNLSQKDIGAILYKYYIDKELGSDFSFDRGKLRAQVESHFKKIPANIIEDNNIFSMISCRQLEGTDYDYLEIEFVGSNDIEGCDYIILQVTSMYDYDGNSCSPKYKDSAAWADVGMFMFDGIDCDFDDLEDEQY